MNTMNYDSRVTETDSEMLVFKSQIPAIFFDSCNCCYKTRC